MGVGITTHYYATDVENEGQVAQALHIDSRHTGCVVHVERYTLQYDYTAGENNDLILTQVIKRLDGGQLHIWTFLRGKWSSDGLRCTDGELMKFVSTVSTEEA